MSDDWKVLNVNSYVDCRDVYRFIKMKKYQHGSIDINKIAYKPLDNISCKSQRYISATTCLPGIVVDGMENPFNKQYRLIDGRHRLLKSMNLDTSFNVYVITVSEVFKFIQL